MASRDFDDADSLPYHQQQSSLSMKEDSNIKANNTDKEEGSGAEPETMGVHKEEAPPSIHVEMRWPPRLYWAAIVVVIASFLSGWHTSVLNTVISGEDHRGSLTKSIHLTTRQKETATALTIAGAAVGSFLSEMPKRLGYRWSMLMYVVKRYSTDSLAACSNIWDTIRTVKATCATTNLFLPSFVSAESRSPIW